MIAIKWCVLSVVIIVATLPGAAQQSFMDEPGIPAFTTSFPVENGLINLANGNLHIEIPIATYPQRGSIKQLQARLVYDSRFWIVQTDQINGTQLWMPSGVAPVGVNLGGGFRLITGGEAGNTNFSQSTQQCGCLSTGINGNTCQPQYRTTYTNYSYQEPNGTNHHAPGTTDANGFKLYQSSQYCTNGGQVPTGSTMAGDDSGYKFVITNNNVTVYHPDGTVEPSPVSGPGAPWLQDTNGNFFTFSAGQDATITNVVDTLGRTPVITTKSGNQVFIDYLCEQGCNPSGGDRARVTVNTAPVQWATQFNQVGVGEYSGSGSSVQSIVFPDGSTYSFIQDSYGMITSMTLPSGGAVTYGYGNFGDQNGNMNRWLISRVADGQTWSFNPAQLGCANASSCQMQVTVTTPAYNDGTVIASDNHVYTFAEAARGNWNTQIQYFRGAVTGVGVLTKTIDYGAPGACPATAGFFQNSVPIRETLSWPGASGTTLAKKVEHCYDTYNNRTVTKEWDYQQNGNFAASPDREIDNVYKSDANYISANLLQLLQSATAKDASGNQAAQTTYGYDDYTTALLQQSFISTQHNSPAGPRGNLTSVSRWLNTTTNPVVSKTAWYDTGEVFQSIDPLTHTSTVYYDATGAYPNKNCNALNQCSFSAYDFNTGLLTTFTDANGTALNDPSHTDTYTYDSMLRPLCTNFPDGGQTCYSYPSPTTKNRQQKITASLPLDLFSTIFDGLGRVSQAQHTTPNGISKVDTNYDPMGRVSSVSNPYFTTADPTYGSAQTLYDALGRPVKITEQDGSVAAIALNVDVNLKTLCTTKTDEAGKQRRSCSDALGRLVEVDEPNAGVTGAASHGSVSISQLTRTPVTVGAQPATTAWGSVTLSGIEKSTVVTTQAATSGSANIQIAGSDFNQQSCTDAQPPRQPTCVTVWDSGTLTVTVNVNGTLISQQTNYGNVAPSTLANNLQSAFANNNSATFTVQYATGADNFTLIAKATGTASNYPISYAITSAQGGSGFSFSRAPTTFIGGANAVTATRFDSGAVNFTVNGHQNSASFGQGDTAVTTANRLISTINADGAAYVSAGLASSAPDQSSASITLTARTAGAAGNYPVSSSYSFDTADFSSSSFTNSAPASLTNGTNASSGTTYYDSGTVTMTLPGFTATAPYGPATNNSATAVVAALAGSGATGLNRPGSPVSATASGAGITLSYLTPGTAGNGAVNVSSVVDASVSAYFSGSTYSGSSSLTGGINPVPADLTTPYITLYQYDALGNLLRVDQKGSAPSDSTQWRTRLFTYDSLSRLLTANNPESGTITYSYDSGGNLLQKTSPLANQTGSATQTISYCYDELHRVTGRAYSAQTCPLASPVVTYAYDSGSNAKGKLTSLTDQAGSANFFYDNLGRMTSETRVINGVSKSMSYDYNPDGSIMTIHYPSGAAVTYTPDSAGRMLSAVDSGNNINYITGAGYQADGQITAFVSGNGTAFAGITNTFSYNRRLQPINMSASAPSQTVFSIGYDFHVGNGDNGNVWGITNYKDNSRNQSFTYDSLNRLTSAQNAGTNCAATTINSKTEYWGNSYTYDAWGNLTNKTVTKCGAENLSAPSLVNNQLSGYGYDAAGNMTSDPTDGGITLNYDEENRIKGAGGYAYTYDADGNRVQKTNGTTGTIYWYMSPGIVAESDPSGVLKSEYVFFAGERIARRDLPGGSVAYYFSDHLKTASVITDSLGNIKSESDYYPWGGELQFVANDSNHYKFTGKERDETGLDYFGARYYSNGLARFITPDWAEHPESIPYADLEDPQSLNQYSYVRNLPTTRADPDGHDGEVTEAVQVTMQEVDSVVKPLVESAGPTLGPAVGFLARYAPPVTVGIALGVEAKMLIDAHSIKVKAKADLQNTIIASQNDQRLRQQQLQAQAKKQEEEAKKEHTKDKRKSTKDKHEKRRPGTSPPPNYKPDRHYMQPKDDKKKDKPKPPYRRKDRDE